MRIYTGQNVFDAALDRIRWLFDEFEHLYVESSGGKDSTVILNLALQVAEEKGRLPLPVFFIDQEAEWQAVIDYMRTTMRDPRVKPYWFQAPLKIFNATSHREPWLHCWEPGAEWVREKEPGSIHENETGEEQFAKLFAAWLRRMHPASQACFISGVRCEESPARLAGLTTYPTYKGETWGTQQTKKLGQVCMYPIYDWSYTDVWKAIHDNDWPYCKLYDVMYQYGLPVNQMRVSNVHHETAVKMLFYVQEIEADTWSRITRRCPGLNTANQMQGDFFMPRELPPMFESWKEYRDYLLEQLLTDGPEKDKLRRMLASTDGKWIDEKTTAQWIKTGISMILVNDYHGTKCRTFYAAHARKLKNRGRISGRKNFRDGSATQDATA